MRGVSKFTPVYDAASDVDVKVDEGGGRGTTGLSF